MLPVRRSTGKSPFVHTFSTAPFSARFVVPLHVMTFVPPAAVFGAMLVFAAAVPVRAADPARADVTVPVAAPDGATIFRVFLTDGTSLVSYGEPARVGDRIVFSMPTSASLDTPPLHLVNLAANHVDWARTERYAETARATRYYETSAEADYA